MSSQNKISVIIPTYNRAAKVVESIRSVLSQVYDSYDVWVIDDGSTDDTHTSVLPFLGSRVHYVYQENAGVTMARNNGICMSRGDYVALLDSDDMCLPDRFQEQSSFLDTHADVDVVFSDLWKVYPDGSRHRFTETVPMFSSVFRSYGSDHYYVIPGKKMFSCLLVELPLKPSTLMVRRSFFDEGNLFDETLTKGERNFLLGLARKGRKFGYIHKPLIELRVWDKSIHLAQPLRGPEHGIVLLERLRRSWRLNPSEDRLVRRGIGLQYYWKGKYLQEKGEYGCASAAFIRGFLTYRNPLFLGHAVSSLLPKSASTAARRLRRGVLASVFKDPWEST